MPVDLTVSLDYRVLLFCIALSALTGIVFGLVPALRATRPDLVIVNQAHAATAFLQQNPVGRRISYQGRTVRIIGVVGTTSSPTIGEDPHPCLYFPIARDPRSNDSLTGITLALRTSGNPARHAPRGEPALWR